MNAFEDIIRKLLEESGYWVQSSYNVKLNDAQKDSLKKPTMPNIDVNLIAYSVEEKTVYILEVSSYLYSDGIKFEDIENDNKYGIPKGRHKILTSGKYRNILKKNIRNQLLKNKSIYQNTKIKFGLIAGNIYQDGETKIEDLFYKKDWLFWGPTEIKKRLKKLLTNQKYEDNIITMTLKLFENEIK